MKMRKQPQQQREVVVQVLYEIRKKYPLILLLPGKPVRMMIVPMSIADMEKKMVIM